MNADRGFKWGLCYIAVGEYRASFDIVNEIVAASVDKDGNLKLRVRVVRREGPKDETGILSDRRLQEPLARKEFDIQLTPTSDQKP